jgi:16S rRNA (guanine1516-N2)-methyltransferase
MRLAVAAVPGVPADAAAAWAERLRLPLEPLGETDAEGLLVWTGERLELRDSRPGAAGPVYVDFVAGQAAHRRRYGGGRGQPLARAAGLKGGRTPAVLDATAGMGRDAFVLAVLGCHVTLLERSPVVGALLEDGLARARRDPKTAPVAARMRLHGGDAAAFLAGLAERPEVVYLDPMYPHRGESALPKKEMRLFRALVGDDRDAPALLEAARRRARGRVVVKRPRAAEPLAGPAPDLSVMSKNTRFDVYLRAG